MMRQGLESSLAHALFEYSGMSRVFAYLSIEYLAQGTLKLHVAGDQKAAELLLLKSILKILGLPFQVLNLGPSVQQAGNINTTPFSCNLSTYSFILMQNEAIHGFLTSWYISSMSWVSNSHFYE